MSEADLTKADNEALGQYMKTMQEECQPDTPSLFQEYIINLHRRERDRALAYFMTKANALSANSNDIQQKLKTLTEKLNQQEKYFFDLNVAKTDKTVQKGVAAFNKAIEDFTKGTMCLHNLDVEKVQIDSVQIAEAAFDVDRKIGPGPDWDRHYLIDYIGSKVIEHRLLNTKNNKLIGYELAMKYFQEMINKCDRKPRLSEEEFNKEHEKAKSRALEAFTLKRNRPDQYKVDILKYKLNQYIIFKYSDLKQMNASATYIATLKNAVIAYDEAFLSPSKLWQYCLHPDDLKKYHEDALCRALRAFRPNRPCSEGFNDADKEERDLHYTLESRFKALADINKVANETAEENGYLEFRFKYNRLINYYLNRWNGLKQRTRRECYDKAIVVGLDAFYKKRHDRNEHAVDIYKDNIISRAKKYAQVDLPDRLSIRYSTSTCT